MVVLTDLERRLVQDFCVTGRPSYNANQRLTESWFYDTK